MKKSWKQYPIKQQLYSHLPPIFKTIRIRWTRYAEHCCRSKNELISDFLLWTYSYGYASVGRSTRTYVQQFCTDTGFSLEDLLGVRDVRDEWRAKASEIRARNTTWYIYIYIYIILFCVAILLVSLCSGPVDWVFTLTSARKYLWRLIYHLIRWVGELNRGWSEDSLCNGYHRGVGEGATPCPGLLHFTLEPYLIMLSVKQGGIKYHFWVFGMTRSGIEPWPFQKDYTQTIQKQTMPKK